MPNQEKNIAADIFTLHIITIQFVMHFFETCVELGLGIGFRAVIDGTFTSDFAEQSYSCIFQTADSDGAAITGIDRRCLSAGNDTALLFYIDTAFAVLSSAEMITGVSIKDLTFHAAENGSAEGELQ